MHYLCASQIGRDGLDQTLKCRFSLIYHYLVMSFPLHPLPNSLLSDSYITVFYYLKPSISFHVLILQDFKLTSLHIRIILKSRKSIIKGIISNWTISLYRRPVLNGQQDFSIELEMNLFETRKRRNSYTTISALGIPWHVFF